MGIDYTINLSLLLLVLVVAHKEVLVKKPIRRTRTVIKKKPVKRNTTRKY